MEYKIAVIPGDGIGPDIIEQALLVLHKVGDRFGHTFTCQTVLAGGAAIDATGNCLPQETIDVCKAADAVLLGAVGGPKWDGLPGDQRPERALLGIRKELGLFANLRPAMIFPELADASPLKAEILEGGLDILVVRELTGGYTDAEIGEHLHMSRFTVRDYVKAMREKTGFRSRTELAVKARQSGLVILEPNPEGSSKKPE